MGFVRRTVLGLPEQRTGSVGSAGGTSPLPGVQPPRRDVLGFEVTAHRALTLPAVYRSMSVLATTGSQLEISVYRRGEQIETPSLIAKPDAWLTLARFIKRCIISLAAHGNLYWHLIRDERGIVRSVEVLNPLAVSIRWDDKGRRWYDYSEALGSRVRSHSWRDTEVSHLRLLEVPGMTLGLGPIQAHRQGLAGALSIRAYADNWLAGSGVPNGVLSTEAELTKDDVTKYREAFKSGVAEHDVAVLGRGLSYEPLFLKPADAQWLESQQFSITDVARMFGLPASYLLAEVNGSSMTYSNLEQVDTAFVRTTLLAYLVEIEDALSDLLPHGQRARFRVEQLLRSDNLTRAKVNAVYLDKGVLTEDEVRIAEGWGPGAPGRPKNAKTTPVADDENEDETEEPAA